MREQSAVQEREAGAPVKLVPAPVADPISVGRLTPKPEVHRQIKSAFEFSKAVLLEENHMKTGSRT